MSDSVPAPEREDRSVTETSPSPSPADIDVDRLRDLAIEVAQEAGTLLTHAATQLAAGEDLGISSKSSATDPVSEADRSAERLIATRLLTVRPDDGLLGEEGQDPRTGTSGLTWIVDPLDGTVNFLYGLPTWSVSIGCADASGPLVGVVYDPNRGETFHAVRGGGAWLRTGDGDRPLRCSEVADLDSTLVSTGFGYERDVRAEQAVDIAALLADVRDIRRAGSAALDLCWTAAGRLDACVEFGLATWDWAAGALMVTEAGGRVSHPRRSYAGHDLPGVIAGGPAAHDHLVRWLEARP
jgi:myo-inositol-1(or 4)-monophosphatase